MIKLVKRKDGLDFVDETGFSWGGSIVKPENSEQFQQRFMLFLLRFETFTSFMATLSLGNEIERKCKELVFRMGKAEIARYFVDFKSENRQQRQETLEAVSALSRTLDLIDYHRDNLTWGGEFIEFKSQVVYCALSSELVRFRITEIHLLDQELSKRIVHAHQTLSELKSHIESKVYKLLNISNGNGQPKGTKLKSANKSYLSETLWDECKKSKDFKPTKYRDGKFSKLLQKSINVIWNEDISDPMSLMKNLKA